MHAGADADAYAHFEGNPIVPIMDRQLRPSSQGPQIGSIVGSFPEEAKNAHLRKNCSFSARLVRQNLHGIRTQASLPFIMSFPLILAAIPAGRHRMLIPSPIH